MSVQSPQRLLIVDDASLLRNLMAEGLRERFPEIEVIEAGGVSEGYRRARESRPGLAILDVSMPDGNGLELSRWIRDELPGMVVCICTLHDEPEFRQAAADSGAACFIAKQRGFWSDAERLVESVFGVASGPSHEGSRETEPAVSE
jgi:DNA-binding NarL/FixJ family response regulator